MRDLFLESGEENARGKDEISFSALSLILFIKSVTLSNQHNQQVYKNVGDRLSEVFIIYPQVFRSGIYLQNFLQESFSQLALCKIVPGGWADSNVRS